MDENVSLEFQNGGNFGAFFQYILLQRTVNLTDVSFSVQDFKEHYTRDLCAYLESIWAYISFQYRLSLKSHKNQGVQIKKMALRTPWDINWRW